MNNAQKGDKILTYDNEQTAAINENKDKIATVEQSVTDLDAKLSKDYIVDYGSNENGSWEKWASGKLVQYVKTKSMITSNTTSGNNYIYNNNEVVVFPINFIEIPKIINNGAVRELGVVWSSTRDIKPDSVDLLLLGATNNASGVAYCEVIGLWK